MPVDTSSDFTSFQTALHFLADEAASKGEGHATYEAMCAQVADHGAPSTAGTTKTATGFGSVFAKLTDTSLYTGASKERFD